MKWLHELWLLNQSSVGLNCLAVGAFPSDYHQSGNVRGDRHLKEITWYFAVLWNQRTYQKGFKPFG